MFQTKKFFQVLGSLAVISGLAFGLSRIATVNAQSSSSIPSGTFTCLINANYSGYIARTKLTTDPQSVNALLVINFNGLTGGSLTGLVINNVNDFETPTATTTTSTSTPSPVNFTITQVTPATNVYRMVSDTPGDVPYYIALANSGNSMFIMSAPSDDKTHNGACQKV